MPLIPQTSGWASALGGITGTAAAILRAQQEKKLRDQQIERQKQKDAEEQAYRFWQQKHGDEQLAIQAMGAGLVPKPGGGFQQYPGPPPEKPADAGAAVGVGLTAAMTGGGTPPPPPAQPNTAATATGTVQTQQGVDPLAQLKTVAQTSQGMASSWETIYNNESHLLMRMKADPMATPEVIRRQQAVVDNAAEKWGAAETRATTALEAVSQAQQKAQAAQQLQVDSAFQNKFYAYTSTPEYQNMPPKQRREKLRLLLAQAPMDKESRSLVTSELASVDKEITEAGLEHHRTVEEQQGERRLEKYLSKVASAGRESPEEKVKIATLIHQMNRDYDNKHPNATAAERARAAIERFNASTTNAGLREQYRNQVNQWLMAGGEASGVPMPAMPAFKMLGGGGGSSPTQRPPGAQHGKKNGVPGWMYPDGSWHPD